MPKLIAYALEDEARATPAFLKLAGPQRTLGEWEEPLALAYVAYGHTDDKGERAVDTFLREHAAALRADELEALAALRDTAWPSLLRAAFENWRMPKIVTMDGEDLVFCEAVFDIDDRDAVLSRLGSHPDMDEDGEGFLWVDRNGRRQLGPGPLHLGSIRFEKGRLVLETKSRERLERGKTLFAELLSGVARHRVDSIKDLDVAMEEAASRPARAPSAEIPADVQAEVIAQLMQRHLASWVDLELPALRGKTPRQAVKTAAGRKQVLAMLKDQENSTLRQPGGDRIDFGVVYAELGLPH